MLLYVIALIISNSILVHGGESMITALTVNNFKSLSRFELKALTPVTLLGGKNNAGKSSVLEAIFLAYDRYNPGMFIRQLSFRGFDTVLMKPENVWAPLFHNFDMKAPISIGITRGSQFEQVQYTLKSNYRKKIAISRPGEPFNNSRLPDVTAMEVRCLHKGKEVHKAHLFFEANGMGMELNQPGGELSQAVFISVSSRGDTAEDAMRFGNLDVVGQTKLVVDTMRIVEPRINDLSTIMIGDKAYIHADVGLNRKVPIKYMGEGISRLLSIVLAIANAKNGCVLIDEIENGIHHSVMKQIWEVIAFASSEFNCQVIATTHSYECLSTACEAMVGKTDLFSYVRLDRNKSNEVVARTFSHELLKIALESDMEVR